ncbi:MAG: ATP-dependent DNA helicase [Nocardioides sp.]
MTKATPTTYTLVRPEVVTEVPTLDEHQQRVVDHAGGPLLVLAGPGTGKTTTLVETIVRRVDEGASPEQILALTFSRKAAEQLRDRVTARLGRTMSTSLSSTFHSFAYGLVRNEDQSEPTRPPLRLLSAPEQEVLLGELVAEREEAVDWPVGLVEARRTRGFAREVAGVVARTIEKGLGFEGLARLGHDAQRPDWIAAAAFMAQYDDVLTSRNLIDYSGLIATAVGMLQDPDNPLRDRLRARFSHVFVDEYQDTDPSQVAMLKAIAGDGRNLLVVGDPHQSIYAFRGADVSGILGFADTFPHADGRPADVVVLRNARRFGPVLLDAAQSVASKLPAPSGISSEERAAFRTPRAVPREHAGELSVETFDSERAEAEHLADLLRRAHLEDGVPWSEMAVLVRSGRATIPPLRRSLVAAGVPVEVSADETPLSKEPAVLPMLDALHAVAEPAWLDPVRAEALLLSPLVGLDATDLRVLARALRARELKSGAAARPSPGLLLEALQQPEVLAAIEGPVAARARRLGDLLSAARTRLDEGGTPEDVMWELWRGTSWPDRLRSAVDRGGAGARLAHRDLDAVCALFDYAARAEEHDGHTGMLSFLETLRAQQIPADTLAERGIRGDAVRLLTAHRSKGLEWRLVVVAHVQEEGWPDLRLRTSLLRADEISRDGLLPRSTGRELLAEERRLFYVACTRARERLAVSGVAAPDDDGEQPSRFLGELGVDVVHREGRPLRPMSLAGLVAELRRTCADDRVPTPVREAAARRLVRVAGAEVAGRPVLPAADPATWWGTRAFSRADAPLRPEDGPVRLTASALTAMARCPARWFLEREAGGEQASNQGQGFGNVVHALADRIARGEIGDGDGDGATLVEELMTHIDQVWAQIPFRTPWSAALERDEARAALARFVSWHQRPDGRELLATEQSFQTEVELPDGTRVALHGYADRLELDADGRVVVIDLKTTKYPPTEAQIRDDPQLGLYQLAVEQGSLDHLVEGRASSALVPAVPGGAELWQLRKQVRGQLKVQQQQPLPAEGERLIETQLMEAVGLIRAEHFPTKPEKAMCERCDFRPMCPAWNSQGIVS